MSALAPPFARLLAAARAAAGAAAPAADAVLALGPAAGGGVTPLPAVDALPERLLVLGWLGTHRDARVPLLRSLWDLEEAARATGRATIALRFAPLVGPGAPLPSQLATARLDARTERALLEPLLEADAVDGLARLLAGAVPWRGWYEVCGRDAVTVGELAVMAAAGAWGAPVAAVAAWEPAAEVLAAQGLAEWAPWAAACGVTPRPIAAAMPAGAVRS